MSRFEQGPAGKFQFWGVGDLVRSTIYMLHINDWYKFNLIEIGSSTTWSPWTRYLSFVECIRGSVGRLRAVAGFPNWKISRHEDAVLVTGVEQVRE